MSAHAGCKMPRSTRSPAPPPTPTGVAGGDLLRELRMRRTSCWLPPPPPSAEFKFPPLLPLALRPPPPPPKGGPRGGECVRMAVAEDGTPRPPTNRGVCWFAVGESMSRAGKEPTDKVLEESDRAFMPKPRLQAPNIGVT